MDQVMEKQGDMIKYLTQQKETLSKRVMELTEKIKRLEESGNSLTEVLI